MTGRLPPHDLDAESAVLSTVLLEPSALDEVRPILQADHFYSPAHKRIWEACVALSDAREPVDARTVGMWLRDREKLAEVGGVPYLAKVVDDTPAIDHVQTYAKAVFQKWRVRQFISTCQKRAAEAYGDVGSVQDFLAATEQEIFDITHLSSATGGGAPLGDSIRSAFTKIMKAGERGGTITGIPSGFPGLDELLSGLHPGDLTIIAARPGMGKSALALCIAINVAAPQTDPAHEQKRRGAIFFSLEMPREQIAVRAACSEAQVSLERVRKGRVTPGDWSALTQASSFLSSISLYIDDTPAVGLMYVRAAVRRVVAEWQRSQKEPVELGAIVIDYLQLMRGSQKRYGAREQEVSEISRALKELAKELSVPVVALSQLNRSVETRSSKDKRPQLSDLRESGAIEQDADNILFVYRDDYYNPDSPAKGIAEIIVAKQRNGPQGKVPMRWSGFCARFDDLPPEQWPAEGAA